jgi:hypothetical protein
VHIDTGGLQVRGVADARELQQLRRVDGAAAQNHLAARPHLLHLAALHHLDADGAQRIVAAFKQDAGDLGMGLQRQIGALERRAQVGHGGAPAPAFVHRHVHGAQTLLLVAVHVLGNRVAGLLASINKGLVQRIAPRAGAHFEGAAVAPVGVAAFGALLGLAKVRQAVRVRPLLHAVL